MRNKYLEENDYIVIFDLKEENKFIIDKEDFKLIEEYTWYVNHGYVVASIKINNTNLFTNMYLHRFLLNLKETKDHADHINGNKLDNRRQNLRISNIHTNAYNQSKQKNNTSGYKGVRNMGIRYKNKPWRVEIRVNDGNKITIGYFADLTEAAKAYDKAALKYHGEFANTNFPKENYD